MNTQLRICETGLAREPPVCMRGRSVKSSSSIPRGLYSPPHSLSMGILQVRMLEWVVISFSRGSWRPRIQTSFLCLLHWQMGSLQLSIMGSPREAYPRVKRSETVQMQKHLSLQRANCSGTKNKSISK